MTCNIALTNGKMDMTLKYFTKKTNIIIEYTKTMIKVTYSHINKMLEIEWKFHPTDDASLIEGGNIKILASQDSMPIIKIGGYCGPFYSTELSYKFILLTSTL